MSDKKKKLILNNLHISARCRVSRAFFWCVRVCVCGGGGCWPFCCCALATQKPGMRRSVAGGRSHDCPYCQLRAEHKQCILWNATQSRKSWPCLCQRSAARDPSRAQCGRAMVRVRLGRTLSLATLSSSASRPLHALVNTPARPRGERAAASAVPPASVSLVASDWRRAPVILWTRRGQRPSTTVGSRTGPPSRAPRHSEETPRATSLKPSRRCNRICRRRDRICRRRDAMAVRRQGCAAREPRVPVARSCCRRRRSRRRSLARPSRRSAPRPWPSRRRAR
mmetsp:Transcript_41266/g.96452  ORF Transcript_41266/g.96452 Transcript_41266/m.96452 type:complete len:281 (+) Transcript_41266:40-882(+)